MSWAVTLFAALTCWTLKSTEGLPLDVWKEIRDELSDAFCGNPATPELAALAYVVSERDIPRQFIFDMLNGVDYWIRFRRFETWEQLDTFASNVGGSLVVVATRLGGVAKPDFEIPALSCGKAVFMTQKLATCCSDLKANRNYLAREDLERFRLDVHRLKMRRACPELNQFVRFTVSRLEKDFYEAGKLVDHLELGAARSVTSLLAMHWKILTRLRMEPELIFNPNGVLSRRDLLALKSRHLLGIEGNIPIFDARPSHHDT